MPTVNLCFDSR